jgi:hypothetical protein
LYYSVQKQSELQKKVKENQFDIWNNLLDINNKSFKNKHYEFNHQISTDGICCSLLFIRKDLKDRKWGSRVPTLPEYTLFNININIYRLFYKLIVLLIYHILSKKGSPPIII